MALPTFGEGDITTLLKRVHAEDGRMHFSEQFRVLNQCVKILTATGASRLMIAAAIGSVESVAFSLMCGDDVNAKSGGGHTALDFAKMHKRHEVVKMLVGITKVDE